MISYLPEIYPDELVYSWFCRYYIHSGCPSNKSALLDLYKKRSDNPQKELIGNINNDVHNTIQSKYGLKKLIFKHTMYPMYARFLPTEMKEKALYHLQYDHCDSHSILPNPPRNESDLNIKYCPLCVIEDRNRFGETYWHREHQIRTVQICVKHNCILHRANVLMKSEHSFVFLPAEFAVNDLNCIYNENEDSYKYSKYLTAVFKSNCDNGENVRNILLNYLIQENYMSKTNVIIKLKILSENFSAYYQSIAIPDYASFSQLQRVLHGNKHDFITICQLGFFLNVPISVLTGSKNDKILTSIRKREKRNIVDWASLDNILCVKLEKISKDIYNGKCNKLGRPERLSERRVYKELGLSSHQLNNLPRCRAIFKKYTEKYEENWIRRVKWAYEQLVREKGKDNIYWSDIRKLSGVKKDKVIDYLKQSNII